MSQIFGWVRSSWSTGVEVPMGKKPEAMAVSESLFTEMDYQIRLAEDKEYQRKIAERDAARVDYTWLVNSSLARTRYVIPELERLELEDICSKIKAPESGTVMSLFRDALLQQQPEPWRIPSLLRAVALQVISSRKKKETTSQWMMKSLTNLRPYRRKISPSSQPGDLTDSADIRREVFAMNHHGSSATASSSFSSEGTWQVDHIV